MNWKIESLNKLKKSTQKIESSYKVKKMTHWIDQLENVNRWNQVVVVKSSTPLDSIDRKIDFLSQKKLFFEHSSNYEWKPNSLS